MGRDGSGNGVCRWRRMAEREDADVRKLRIPRNDKKTKIREKRKQIRRKRNDEHEFRVFPATPRALQVPAAIKQRRACDYQA